MTVLATAFSPKEQRGTGEHEPMLMAIDYGKGRVFHTALGHDERTWGEIGFMRLLENGRAIAVRRVIPLADGVPRATNVEYYAQIVKEKATLRNLIHSAKKILTSAYEAEEAPDEPLDDPPA